MEKNTTKLLIVDDEPMNLFVFKDIFSSNKAFVCQYAENGEKALEILLDFTPDIVLLDIMMPGIDGYEVCKNIRQDQKNPFLKIIMVSGKGMLNERLKGYESGADDYIVKPFDKDELLAKINVFKRLKRVEEIENNQSSLLTLLAHETKTPMSGIMGAVELLMNEDLLASQMDLLRIVYDSSNQLLIFIEKISLYYRLLHKPSLRFVSLDILFLIDGVLEELQKIIVDKSVKIEWKNRKANIIKADWYLMQIAMKNIIENAVKYSNENDVIEISINHDTTYCNVLISDNGPGISNEDQQKVFDAFSIKDIKHHHKGLGLSLATSRLIIESHNGRIKILNKSETKGTTFSIQLPIHKEKSTS